MPAPVSPPHLSGPWSPGRTDPPPQRRALSPPHSKNQNNQNQNKRQKKEVSEDRKGEKQPRANLGASGMAAAFPGRAGSGCLQPSGMLQARSPTLSLSQVTPQPQGAPVPVRQEGPLHTDPSR